MSVDLRNCKPGDKLVSKHGIILTYVGPNELLFADTYPHKVRYPEGELIDPNDPSPGRFGSESYGFRTDDGFVFRKPEDRLDSDHDIVEIIPASE